MAIFQQEICVSATESKDAKYCDCILKFTSKTHQLSKYRWRIYDIRDDLLQSYHKRDFSWQTLKFFEQKNLGGGIGMYMVVPCDIYSGTGIGFNVIEDTLGINWWYAYGWNKGVKLLHMVRWFRTICIKLSALFNCIKSIKIWGLCVSQCFIYCILSLFEKIVMYFR